MDTPLFALIVSILTTASAIWGMQCKKMKFVITGQLVANSLLGLQYVIEGAWSAAYTLPFAIALSVISLVFTEKGRKLPEWVIYSFIGAFALVVILPPVFDASDFGWLTLISTVLMFAALCFFVLSITSTASYKARICSATNCLLWLIYDIINAPSAILTHGVLLAFIVVGIVRLDRAEWRRFYERVVLRRTISEPARDDADVELSDK